MLTSSAHLSMHKDVHKVHYKFSPGFIARYYKLSTGIPRPFQFGRGELVVKFLRLPASAHMHGSKVHILRVKK
jgi:hypothetical protein